jgi:hypothetical protein
VRSIVTASSRGARCFPGGLVSFPQVIPDGHPVLARLLTGIDVFTWWSVVIIAFGLCAAADLKPRKSIPAIAIGFVLYLVVTNLIMGGPPPGAGR